MIFGAGFSNAISTRMPLVNDLGVLAIERAGLDRDTEIPSFPFSAAFTFENWLTSLAEDQPHLSQAENSQNRALFTRLKTAIAQVLTEIERSVVEEDQPPWLAQLTLLLHHRRATVMTFNYDRLLEVSLERLYLVHDAPWSPRMVEVRDTLWGLPPVPSFSGEPDGGFAPTFRLLKLHGSLDWWIAPNDDNGTSLLRHESQLINDVPRPLSETERSRTLPGREIFIVPPMLSKSPYYRNFVTRELWRTSFKALREAKTISIVGYSLPAADVMLLGMLEQATRGRDVRIEVVNLDTSDVASRLDAMEFLNVVEYSGEECLPKFVSAFAERSEADLRELLRYRGPVVPPDNALVVTTKVGADSLYSRVVEIHLDETTGMAVLKAIPRGRNLSIAASGDEFGEVKPRPMAVELAKAIEDAKGIVIREGKRTLRPVSAEIAWGHSGGGPVALLLCAVDAG